MAGIATAAPAIELRGVTKTFRLESGEEVRAVDDVTLEIPAGELVCVLGPSGHGKSTLLNMVAGFTEPTAGEVLSRGAEITGPGPDRGVVFQRDTLFLWRRVADNIGFGLKARGVPKAEREEIVARYLRIIGMEGYAKAWPKQLSGGMRRRVAIAAVFANEPEVLLMDEPFVGLDYARRATLHEVLLELWERSRPTVFFITHDVDEALALADRILVVVRGQIVMEERLGLERPRTVADLATDDLGRLRARVLEHLELGGEVGVSLETATTAAVAPARRRARPAGALPSRPWVVALSVVGMVVIWHVVSALAGENKSGEALVPTLSDIAGSVDRFADYWKGGLGVEATRVGGEVTWQGVVLGFLYNVGLTAWRLAAGLTVGIFAGLALATAVSWSTVLRGLFTLPGHLARMLPLLAMVPLFSLWFGNTEQGAILFIGFTAFSLVFAIALNAIANVPGYYGQFSASLGASRGRTYLTVVLPAALPEIRAGVMLAVGFGWSAAIAAEYLGQEYGLGHIVQNAEFFGRTNLLALIALITLVLAAISLYATGRLLDWVTRWAE